MRFCFFRFVFLYRFKVDGHDLRDASHDEAVEIIRNAKNPVRFVVRTVTPGTGTVPESSGTPDILINTVRFFLCFMERVTFNLSTALVNQSRTSIFGYSEEKTALLDCSAF